MSVSYDDKRVWLNIDSALKDDLLLKIVSTLECLICSEVMHVPFLAACGHSFCYGCLDAWFQTKVNCPTCRKDMMEPPVLNILLKDTSRAITDLIIESLEDERHRNELRASRTQLLEDFERDSRSKLFGDAFTNAPTLVDMSDGVPRCGNCHWEAHGSVCLNCGSRFRHPTDDLYYDSEDGDAYDEDGDEVLINGIEPNEYDSQDSFVDNNEYSDGWENDADEDDAEGLEINDAAGWENNGADDWDVHSGSDFGEAPTASPWGGLSDEEVDNRLAEQLDEEHDSDIQEFNGRLRRAYVVSSDEEYT